MFVLGRPHSGTTLVQLMLHARPRIALPPETLPHGLKGTGDSPNLLPLRRTAGLRRSGEPTGTWNTRLTPNQIRLSEAALGRRTLDRLARVCEPGPTACRPGTG
ncbi:sulfotransferase [Streptomyces mirabilis]|uniref:sulfotransferase n=1 Tax=Streptomyces mirabilis TaxID=68239 RepID=UPI003243D4BD